MSTCRLGAALVVTATTVVVTSLAACGEEQPPPGTAATVGGDVIAQVDVQRELKAALIDEGVAPGDFSPPAFPGCMAHKHAEPAFRDRTEANLMAQCRVEYGFNRGRALQRLIRASWLDKEAERLGIDASEAKLRGEHGPGLVGLAAGSAGLAGGSATKRALAQARAGELENQLLQRVQVSDDDVRAYYVKRLGQFTHPEERVVRLVRASTKREALRLRSALEGGVSWAAVARRSSGSRSDGAAETMLEGHVRDKAVGQLAFSVPAGRISGPVKSAGRWSVLEVERIAAGGPNSLAQVSETIRYRLQVFRRDRALHRRYADDTDCAAQYEIPEIPECLDKPLPL